MQNTNTIAGDNSETSMLVGARAIADAMGIPARRVYDMAERKELPLVKLGGSIAIRRVKLIEFLQGLEHTGTASA